LLWASPRELLNIVQAELAGAQIITVPPEMLKKMALFGKSLADYSLDTVRMFSLGRGRRGLQAMSGSAFTQLFLKESAELVSALDGAVIDRWLTAWPELATAAVGCSSWASAALPAMPVTRSTTFASCARSKRMRRPTTSPS